MDQYSSLGSGLGILIPTERVLRVSAKNGPGGQRDKKKKERNKAQHRALKGISTKTHFRPTETEEPYDGKGKEIDVVI